MQLCTEAEESLSLATDPIDFFNLLFDGDLLEMIVVESNLYAQKKGISLQLTICELKTVIGILLLSGYNILPSVKLYWASENDVKNNLVARLMSRNRFLTILSNIHLNHVPDPHDKASKLRPLFQKVSDNFKKFLQRDENVCIDESMIRYFGRHPCKQFIMGKPIRYGFKM